MSVSVTYTTKSTLPGVPFRAICDHAMGAEYELSLVIIGKTRMRGLNRERRGKDYPTDILSFSLGEKMGEIFLNPDKIKIKAKQFCLSYKDYVGFLFIHGLLHLKGMDHGSTMEEAERKLCEEFSIAHPHEKTTKDNHRD